MCETASGEKATTEERVSLGGDFGLAKLCTVGGAVRDIFDFSVSIHI